VLLLPGPFESLIGGLRYRWVHDLPLIEVVRESEWRLRLPVKRLLDLAAGFLLLLLAFPVLAVCAAAVKLTSPGPVLYRQVRVGRGQRPFTLWKLRTMRVDAEAETVEVLAQPGDPRLTSIGAFLRRFRLDEVPQLVNVLRGEMSLVGPRPERPGFVQRYLKEVPGYAERFSLAPGLTGLAQVNGDYHSSPQNKLRYELAYMANWSLWLDLSILLRTVKIVLTSQGV
jgi:exopolysaccharide biosynthesis polyprenyl glycosylphosphotransferase